MLDIVMRLIEAVSDFDADDATLVMAAADTDLDASCDLRLSIRGSAPFIDHEPRLFRVQITPVTDDGHDE